MPEDFIYTDSMNRLIEQFAALPGIGRRTAERLAFHILKSAPDDALALARAIDDVKSSVRHCSICYNLTEKDPCLICASPSRNPHIILVVEQPKDVITLEQTGSYDGTYHVLLGHINPLEGIKPQDLTLNALIQRVTELADKLNPEAEDYAPIEVILGLNPNMEGDGTGLFITQQLNNLPHVAVTRLARGLPTGSQLEYANKAVLSDAITARQQVK